jgi:hypothetical protein
VLRTARCRRERRAGQPDQDQQGQEDLAGEPEQIVSREHVSLVGDGPVELLQRSRVRKSQRLEMVQSLCAAGAVGGDALGELAVVQISRLSHSVMLREVPKLPPRMRKKLERPEALATRLAGSPDSTMEMSGTKKVATPSPCTKQ